MLISNVTSNENKTKELFTLQLVLINYCNLSCQYCFVRKQDNQIMPIEIAKAAINKMLNDFPSDNWRYFICFMGGEPLIAFKQMQDICEWVWNSFPDIDVKFNSPTNGTLLTESMRNWLLMNKSKITLALSYDGYDIQDTNRSDSNDLIDVQFFSKAWPIQPFKMTISQNTVHKLAYNIIALQEKGILVSANGACGEPQWSDDSIREYGKQMLILADYYLSHPEMSMVNLINFDLRFALASETDMIKMCGIGTNYKTIDIDGSECACHMFSSLGLNHEQKESAKKYHMECTNDYSVDYCKKCVLNKICNRCYGITFREFGTPFAIDKNLCELFKQQIRGACSYHIKRMATLTELTQKDKQIVMGIKAIIKHIVWLT